MVYIFSNAHRHKTVAEFHSALNKYFKEESDDKFIFLNDAVPYDKNAEMWKKFRNNYTILREFKFGLKSYFGLETIFKNHREYISQICLLDNNGKCTMFNPKYQDIVTSKSIEIPAEYPKGSIPTTGYCAVLFAQKFFANDEICLVNFFGSADNSTPKDRAHKWDYEESVLKKIKHIEI